MTSVYKLNSHLQNMMYCHQEFDIQPSFTFHFTFHVNIHSIDYIIYICLGRINSVKINEKLTNKFSVLFIKILDAMIF